MQHHRIYAVACSHIFRWFLVLFLALPILCRAQFPPLLSEDDLTVIQSPVNNNITIAFKSPPVGTCTSVFSTQKQYSGYIRLPANALTPSQGNYTINTFFWFIEARQVPEDAPFTVFINGGPGSSSMIGMFQEVGPCEVIEVARGRFGTVARDWGWDRSSNMLFVDQPVQVGFSYDMATNGSLNLLNELFASPATSVPITQPPYTFLNGTFSSNSPAFTANTSQIAATSMWHFVQTFFSIFPQYNTQSRMTGRGEQGKPGINLFTESYGGKYAPAIAKFFRQQNARRVSDLSFANLTLDVEVASLGIINGWVDLLTQIPFNPRFAFNNSYGVQAVSQVQELNALSSFSAVDGCQARTLACHQLEATVDPSDTGAFENVNNVCSSAAAVCQNDVVAPYTLSGRSLYDISQHRLDPFPSPLYLEYLNIAEVQNAIGAPVNYTQDSQAVAVAFNETGDYARNGVLDDLIETLNAGTRVALIYGDRDYICNWLGGEAVSFAIAGGAGLSYQPWYAAGYAPIVTNNTYIGGVVREYGNLSFSRIYDAGHLVPAFQPETAFVVFSRIIQGTGISLGSVVDLSSFASSGQSNSTYKNTAPVAAAPVCFIRAVNTTCDTDHKNMLANGAGVIVNGVLYSDESQWTSPPASLVTVAGFPGTAPQSIAVASSSHVSTSPSMSADTSTSGDNRPSSVTSNSRVPTGVFTATAIPSVTSSSTTNAAASTGPFKQNVFLDHDAPQAAMMAFGLLSFGLL